MIRFFVYLFPALVNCITGGIFFFAASSFSQAGLPGWIVGSTMAAWAVVYSLGSFLTGFIVTRKNAPFLVAGGAFLLAGACLLYMIFPDAIYGQFAFIGAAGAGAALYCTPFQVFMKSLEPDGGAGAGAVRATALYEISWSLGVGTGPFLFAMFTQRTGFTAMAVTGTAVAILVMLLHFTISGQSGKIDGKAEKPQNTTSDYKNAPDLAATAWLVGGIGTFAISIIRSLEPFRGKLAGFDLKDVALALALVSYVQAAVALALIKSKDWMFSAKRAGLTGLSGIAGLILFGLGTEVWCFYAGAVLFGIFSGCFYFIFVFHSIIHPTKSSKYLAVNEMVVGFAGMGGPLAGGLLAGAGSLTLSGMPFILSSLLVAGATVLHVKTLAKVKFKK